MLEIKAVSGGYGAKKVLENINAVFPSGHIVSVIGENGCGKSTLLQMCCGLLRPSEGKVAINGEDISKMKRRDIALKVSYMEQSHNPGSITVRALVSHGRFPHLGYPRRLTARDKEAVELALSDANAIGFADMNVSELSGGQQQRAYIAMTLAQDADIVLMDEPCTYLDIGGCFEIVRLAEKLKKRGKTVIMVLHDLNMALSCADIAAVMKNGRLLGAAAPQEIIEKGLISEAFGVDARRDEKSGQYLFFGKDMEYEKSGY